MRKSKKSVELFPILSFGHVKGLARLFLEVEIMLSILIVIGTFALFITNLLP